MNTYNRVVLVGLCLLLAPGLAIAEGDGAPAPKPQGQLPAPTTPARLSLPAPVVPFRAMLPAPALQPARVEPVGDEIPREEIPIGVPSGIADEQGNAAPGTIAEEETVEPVEIVEEGNVDIVRVGTGDRQLVFRFPAEPQTDAQKTAWQNLTPKQQQRFQSLRFMMLKGMAQTLAFGHRADTVLAPIRDRVSGVMSFTGDRARALVRPEEAAEGEGARGETQQRFRVNGLEAPKTPKKPLTQEERFRLMQESLSALDRDIWDHAKPLGKPSEIQGWLFYGYTGALKALGLGDSHGPGGLVRFGINLADKAVTLEFSANTLRSKTHLGLAAGLSRSLKAGVTFSTKRVGDPARISTNGHEFQTPAVPVPIPGLGTPRALVNFNPGAVSYGFAFGRGLLNFLDFFNDTSLDTVTDAAANFTASYHNAASAPLLRLTLGVKWPFFHVQTSISPEMVANGARHVGDGLRRLAARIDETAPDDLIDWPTLRQAETDDLIQVEPLVTREQLASTGRYLREAFSRVAQAARRAACFGLRNLAEGYSHMPPNHP